MQNLTTATTADKLKASRERLAHVARDVRMSEGHLLDFEAAEVIVLGQCARGAVKFCRLKV